MVQEKRRARRQAIAQDAVICDSKGGLICGCTLSDVSKSGGRLRLPSPDPEIPSEFILILSRGGRVQRRCDTVWRDGDSLGVRFITLPDAET
jgi:hypothetical protein